MRARASFEPSDWLGLTLGLTQGFMNELGCRVEELGDIEGGLVISLYTIIMDVGIAVVISTSQHIIKLSLSCVKNVSNAQISQTRTLQSSFPETKSLSSCIRLPLFACVCECVFTHSSPM